MQSEEDTRHRFEESDFSSTGWGRTHSVTLLTGSDTLIKPPGFCFTGSLHPSLPLSWWHDWNGRWGGRSLFKTASCFPLLTSTQPHHLTCLETQWSPHSCKTQCCKPLRIQCNYSLIFRLACLHFIFQFLLVLVLVLAKFLFPVNKKSIFITTENNNDTFIVFINIFN